MNRMNDAVLGMYKAVHQFLFNNTATITATGVDVITTYKDELEDQIEAIEAKAVLTAVSSLGITETKKAKREAATKSAYIVAGAVYAYAVDSGNTELAVNMNFTPASLKSKKDEEIVEVLTTIWAEASELVNVTAPAVNPLVDYGVIAATVTALEALITAYSTVTESPRILISNRKTDNQALATLYASTNTLLFKLDRIMDGQADAYPTFFTGYKNARIIIVNTYSTRIAGVVSKITNPELMTTALADNAKITIIPQPYTREKNGQTISVTGRTEIVYSDNGDYSQDTPDIHARYTVICSLPGFATQQVTDVKVKKGKKTPIDFRMEPVVAD